MNSTTNQTQVAIFKQLKKICSCNEFKTKPQLCKLLKYLISETVEGREEKLKGYTIGLEVFNKDHNFDSDQNPLVRIHAGRLRRALKMYYLEEGKNDALRIDIPKGKYIPIISYAKIDSVEQIRISNPQKNLSKGASVAILPFKNLTANREEDYFALGFAEELSVILTKFDFLSVFGSIPFANSTISDNKKINFINQKGIRFIIEGGVHHYGNKIKILVKLIDSLKNEQVWAERYLQELTAHNLLEIQENIAIEIAGKVGSEYGIICQQLFAESLHTKPKNLGSLDAILRFHYYEANHSPDAAAQAFNMLHHALETEPNLGITTAMLACLYGNQYMLSIPDYEDCLKQFSRLAEKAIKLEPNGLTVNIVLAYKYFANNEKDLFFKEAEKCLSLNPNSSMRLGVLGQYLSLYGDWERGKSILDRAMQMNVSFPLYFFGPTTLYYYRKKEYDKALIEANQYNLPALFWGPMLRAATLGQLNKLTEAEPNIAHLKELKPNFEDEAHYLISRFVKEEELVEHVIEGLKKAGMDL